MNHLKSPKHAKPVASIEFRENFKCNYIHYAHFTIKAFSGIVRATTNLFQICTTMCTLFRWLFTFANVDPHSLVTSSHRFPFNRFWSTDLEKKNIEPNPVEVGSCCLILMWGITLPFYAKHLPMKLRIFNFQPNKILQVHQNMIESFSHLKPHNNNWYLVSKHNKFHPIDIVYMKLQNKYWAAIWLWLYLDILLLMMNKKKKKQCLA